MKHLAWVALACFSTAALAQKRSPEAEGPQPVQVVVRAESKDAAPVLQASDIKVQFDGHDTPVSALQSLMPRAGAGPRVEIALLIDDGLRSSFGVQLRDVERFVQSTAGGNVAIGVGYMRNGGAYFPEGFSNDPEVAVKAIRLPISSAGIDGSPYFCLQDLAKKWPQHPNTARVALMISSGIDRYNGSVSPLNQDSPYVTEAIKDVQKANFPVYSIYYGRREVNGNFSSMSGQGYLTQTAEGTGGELFNMGQINPVSLDPYFKSFKQALSNSYLLTFQTGSNRLDRLKVTSDQKSVKLRVQTVAGVEGAK